MSTRPRPSNAPRPERRMLTRPETHDTVANLERFVCLDLQSAVLSRAACAARYVSTIRPGSASASRALDPGPCRGCPVGKLHASERGTDEARAGLVLVASGRGTAAKPGHASAGTPARCGAIRPGSYATRPEPTVEAPAAVVPAKRPSAYLAWPPAAETATTKTLAHADAQHGSPERAPVSPVEIADPPLSPPAAQQVSTGQRPTVPKGCIVCKGCGKQCERTGQNQRWCPACRPTPAQEKARSRARQRERTPERDRRYISVAPKSERSTPVLTPERPTTSVAAVPTFEASERRVRNPRTPSAIQYPHLDALAAELLDLAIGVVQARAIRDEAAARHDEAAARHDRLLREYRMRVAAVVNGAAE